MEQPSQDLFDATRELLTSRLHGVLATHSQELPGYPFGSVVPYSLSPAGWPMFLLSHLAKHTRNLLENPQCSLTITEAGEGDIQQLMRLTCMGEIHPLNAPDSAVIERHFRSRSHGHRRVIQHRAKVGLFADILEGLDQ